MRKANIFFAVSLLLVCAVTASAQQKFSAYLSGGQHVPQVNTAAAGTGIVTLNTAETQITVTLSYAGLSSAAYAAHIHGTASYGQNAPVLFNFQGVSGTLNTVTGTFAVNSKDVQALRAHRFYFNIHTPNFPNGEIRGQIRPVSLTDDIDGDGRSDLSVLRLAPADQNITDSFVLNSLDNSFSARRIPFVVDQSVYGDFNADGRNDLDAIRIDPPTGNYLNNILNISSTSPATFFLGSFQWGSNNLGDLPIGGDFDGDGIPDRVVYRKTNGTWYIQQSSNNAIRYEQFGISTDIPAASDYDRDGKTDLAVVRNVNGQFIWYIRQSSNNALRSFQFGQAATDAVLNRFFYVDFDGDGSADPAVVRRIDGLRFIYALQSSDNSLYSIQWGLRSDVSAIADADGDGKSDVIAVRRVPEFAGQLFWYIRQSSNTQLRLVQFGLGTDAFVSVD